MLAGKIGKAAILISFMMSASPAHAQSSSDLVDGLIRLGVGIAVQQLTQGDQARSPQSRSQGNSKLPSASRYPVSEVRSWQQKLNALGFDAGPEDGVFGGRTSRAIASYQHSIGAPATGVLTTRQREALLATPRVMQSEVSAPHLSDTPGYSAHAQSNVGLSRSEIRQAQSWLNAMGFDAGTADGVFGGRSLTALNAFQRAGGFMPTQNINREVFDQLRSANNMGFAAGERSPSVNGEPPAGNHLQITDRGTGNAMATIHAIENPGETRRSWDFFVADNVPVFGLQGGNAPVFFRLVRLGADPGLLDRVERGDDFALELAVDHLPRRSPIRDRYLNYSQWAGSNEFEQARTREAFLEAYRDELLALAPRPPFDVYVNADHRLRSYDTERGGFDLPKPRLDLNALARPFIRGSFENEADVDDLFWSMDASEAETTLEHLAGSATSQASDRLVHILSRIEIVSIDQSGEAMFRLKRFDLFDRPFATQLASFPAIADSEPEPLPEGATVSSLGHLMTPPPGLLPVELAFHDGTALVDRDASVHIFALILLTKRDDMDARTQCSLLRLVMTNDVLKRYVDTENYCRTADGWLGADEFERADNRAAFWQQYGPAIDAFAPAAPFQMGRMYDALWREYDASKGGFELASSPSNALSELRRPDAGPKLGMFRNFDWPERIVRMDEADARAFRSRMHTWQQPAKELMILEISQIDFAQGQAIIDLVSLDILDPTLSETIYSFDVAPTVDTVEVGNRPLAFTEPVELNDLFEAGLIVGTLQASADERDQDRLTRELYDRDRLAYRTAQTFEGFPSNHVTLPFFSRQVTHRGSWEDTRRDNGHMPRLHSWAGAFVDGLPDEAQLLSNLNLARDGDTVSIGVESGLGGNRLRDVEGVLSQQGWLEDQVLISSYSDAASILYVLPNRRDLYSLSFDRNWLDGFPSAGRRQLARFEIKDISQIEDDRGQPVVVVSLKPVSLSLLIDGQEIASTTFDDVPDLSEAGFVAEGPSSDAVAFVQAEPLPLSRNLIDLLITAHSSRGLSTGSQYGLLARRWHYENENSDPAGGRFFVQGQRLPTTAEAQQVLPAFIDWAAGVAPALPVQIALTGTGNWSPARNNSPGWGILGCFGTGMSQDERIAWSAFGRSVNSLEMRKSMAEQTVTSGWTLEDERRLLVSRSLEAARNFIHRPLGECGKPSLSNQPSDELRSIFILSQMMPRPLTTDSSDRVRLAADAVLSLTSIESVETLPTADRLLDGDYAEYMPQLSSESENRDFVAFHFEPRTVIYHDERGEAIESQAGLTLASLKADLESALAANVPPSASGTPYGRDIVGIQLGMTFEDAEAIVREHMDVGKVLQGRRAFDSQLQTGQTIPLTSGMLFISTDGREMIALIDEPPAAENRVLAAWRRIYMEPGTVQPSQIIASLEQKYGSPGPRGRLSEVAKNIWNEPSGNDCRGLYQWGQPQALASRWTEDGSELSITDPDGSPMPDAVYPNALMNPLGQSRAEVSTCGPFLTAALNFDASRRQSSGYDTRGMDVIDQTLTDFGPYIEAFEASRAMIADQSASSGSGAFDAPFGPDMVGLRLGMSLDDAKEVVMSRLGETARKFETTGFSHYESGAAYAAEDNREIIALLEDPAAPGRLVAAWRRIYAPAGTSSTAILGDIVAKYGQPVWSNDESSQYFFAESTDTACDAALGTYFSPEKRMTELWRPAQGGEEQPWAMPDGFNDPYAPRLLATLPDSESPAACPTLFGVALNLSFEGGYIDTALTDQEKVNMMRQSPPSGDAGADVGIKF